MQKLDGIGRDEVLDKFIQGLKPDLQLEVLKADPVTFDNACTLAKNNLHGLTMSSMTISIQAIARAKANSMVHTIQTTCHPMCK